MKCKVLVLSHGNLAESLVRTAELIIGENDLMHYINMPDDFNLCEYKNSIEQVINDNPDGILILTDLLGGSPFLAVSQIVRNYYEQVEVVTGCSLSMLLQVGLSIEDKTVEELKEIAIQNGIDGIIDLKERLGNRV